MEVAKRVDIKCCHHKKKRKWYEGVLIKAKVVIISKYIQSTYKVLCQEYLSKAGKMFNYSF